MAPIGLAIGLIITNVGTGDVVDAPVAVIEALATGTFLYVTFLELVPHEFMGNVQRGPQKVLGNGLRNMFFLFMGNHIFNTKF